jgi:hypothetical protein
MSSLKLLALDDEDLRIVSAHVQDAVLKVGEIDFRAREKRLVLPMNRFVWEAAGGRFSRHNERRRSVLHFDRVLGVKATGIARDKQDDVLALLTIGFTPTDPPAGFVDLTFAAGATLRLEVECIEARLADLGGAWQAGARPSHKV